MDANLTSISTADLQTAVSHCAVSPSSSRAKFANWAKTFECLPERVFEPVDALQCRQVLELARREGKNLRPVGVGHSPSDLTCTRGWMIRMDSYGGLVQIHHGPSTLTESTSATFKAGTTLHQIHKLLSQASPPLALPNIGSISDQTIAGLISTASHGSGVNYPVISNHVRSLLLALPLPGAPIVRVSRTEDAELFKASLCGLGATGLILEVEIEAEPAYRLRESKTPMKVEDVLERLDEIKQSAEHARVWWYPDGKGMIVGRADRTYEPAKPVPSLWAHILGYHVTQFFLFCSRYFPSLTPWVGMWAWWLVNQRSVVVDEGHKVLNFDCLFPQYTVEWAIPSSNGKACLAEIQAWFAKEASDPNGVKTHFPMEIRWSCADDIYLSPSYGRETLWIGIVTYRPYGLAMPYRKLHDTFSSILASHGGRPHWAKTHNLNPKSIEDLYPEWEVFRRVCDRADPEHVLRSEYLLRHLEGKDVDEREFKSYNPRSTSALGNGNGNGNGNDLSVMEVEEVDI
ncbi:D-arabinono-1,4-lactone oxidase [Tremella mesenterica]|uniref:D-arabinono-1,4-lactone oxidase n=1 Tax=Tremella mesenterica TaxID=5217 RepID=A0A4Q1BQV2_TREME|nr:D-arabinono-1,4-lactone oxidase [Tremella mesenterica]